MAKQQSETRDDTDTIFGAFLGMMETWGRQRWLLPALVAAACILAYVRFLAMPPMLDEQFLLAWAHRAGRAQTPLLEFLQWRGFAPADLWGFNTTFFVKLSDLLLFAAPFLLRLERLIIHIAACIFLFFAGKMLLPSTSCAFLAAIIFAIYPLNPESVLWLGGIGSLLAGFLFILSLWMYQKQRWPWLLASLILFGASLMSSAAVWPLALFYAVYELFRRFGPQEDEAETLSDSSRMATGQFDSGAVKSVSSQTTMALVAPLLFFVLTAAYIAGTGYLALMSVDAGPHFQLGSIGSTVRACFFPINESISSHYVRHYRFLYIFLPPLALALAVAVWRYRNWRIYGALLTVWLLLALVPVIGHVDVRGTMFGAHLLYPAMMPLACVLSLGICAIAEALGRWRTVGGAVSAVIALVFLVFVLSHTWSQNIAYEQGAKQLAAIQKSMKIVYGKTGAPYLLVRDIPKTVALLPGLIHNRMVVFDGEKRLLSSNELSAGALKDQLRQGKYADLALRWAEDAQSLLPIELGTDSQLDPSQVTPLPVDSTVAANEPWERRHPGGSNLSFNVDAEQLSKRLAPSLEFYKQAHIDTQTGDLILDSNSTSGPVIRLAASGFSPLAPDFLYVDAKIEAPKTEARPLIELYWTTRDQEKYDEKRRRVWTAAIVGDQQFHRYYLPLRGIGWLTAGPAEFLTLGFPAGAKVWLHGFGGCGQTGVSPAFTVVAQPQVHAHQFNAPFFNFPNVPALGMCRLEPSAKTVSITYDCSAIPNAFGAMIEISMPNQAFPNTNGNEASGVGGTMVSVAGARGGYEIPISKFPLPGLYGLRVIAADANRRPIGQFSDDFYCLVTRRMQNGWAE